MFSSTILKRILSKVLKSSLELTMKRMVYTFIDHAEDLNVNDAWVLKSSNKCSMVSSEVEEDLSDSDNERDTMNLMTPSGKKIYRDRPVKPSTKALRR